eukprot:TRINITY_DN2669_c0_g1_i2.p1 TRINITY_DN2669_c0_g1~~TRINITY_DN2669_c0_g1_i2.p1  ORF type:complete len:805 (+),score=171.23 TRINITY_DN2669_c0_g1_i2:74-2488(+)
MLPLHIFVGSYFNVKVFDDKFLDQSIKFLKYLIGRPGDKVGDHKIDDGKNVVHLFIQALGPLIKAHKISKKKDVLLGLLGCVLTKKNYMNRDNEGNYPHFYIKNKFLMNCYLELVDKNFVMTQKNLMLQTYHDKMKEITVTSIVAESYSKKKTEMKNIRRKYLKMVEEYKKGINNTDTNNLYDFIKKGETVLIPDSDGNVLLHHATIRKDVSLIKKLNKIKVNLNEVNYKNQTALHCLTYQLKKNMDPNELQLVEEIFTSFIAREAKVTLLDNNNKDVLRLFAESKVESVTIAKAIFGRIASLFTQTSWLNEMDYPFLYGMIKQKKESNEMRKTTFNLSYEVTNSKVLDSPMVEENTSPSESQENPIISNKSLKKSNSSLPKVNKYSFELKLDPINPWSVQTQDGDYDIKLNNFKDKFTYQLKYKENQSYQDFLSYIKNKLNLIEFDDESFYICNADSMEMNKNEFEDFTKDLCKNLGEKKTIFATVMHSNINIWKKNQRYIKLPDSRYFELVREKQNSGNFGVIDKYRIKTEANSKFRETISVLGNNRYIAVKRPKKAIDPENNNDKDNILWRFELELHEMFYGLLNKSTCINILRYVGCTNFHIITEWCEGEDLSSYIRSFQNNMSHLAFHSNTSSHPTITEKTPTYNQMNWVYYGESVARACSFLEQYGLVHRDIACRNVLVRNWNPNLTPSHTVCLGDFGLTRVTNPKNINTPQLQEKLMEIEKNPNNINFDIRIIPPEEFKTNRSSGDISNKTDVKKKYIIFFIYLFKFLFKFCFLFFFISTFFIIKFFGCINYKLFLF